MTIKGGGLKSLFDDMISAVDDFLTNRIQELQHWWKKCLNLIIYLAMVQGQKCEVHIKTH